MSRSIDLFFASMSAHHAPINRLRKAKSLKDAERQTRAADLRANRTPRRPSLRLVVSNREPRHEQR